MATLNAYTFKTRDDAEDYYLALVDVWAGENRRIAPAQEAVYRRKLAEAEAGSGSLIDAEATALGIDPSLLCQRIITANAAQEQVWADIEIQRVTAKADIRSADTPAHMHGICKQLKG